MHNNAFFHYHGNTNTDGDFYPSEHLLWVIASDSLYSHFIRENELSVFGMFFNVGLLESFCEEPAENEKILQNTWKTICRDTNLTKLTPLHECV